MERNVSILSVATEDRFANHCLLGVSCLTYLYHDLLIHKRKTLPAFLILPVKLFQWSMSKMISRKKCKVVFNNIHFNNNIFISQVRE